MIIVRSADEGGRLGPESAFFLASSLVTPGLQISGGCWARKPEYDVLMSNRRAGGATTSTPNRCSALQDQPGEHPCTPAVEPRFYLVKQRSVAGDVL